MEEQRSRRDLEGSRLMETGAVLAFVLALVAWILLGPASIFLWLISLGISVYVVRLIRRDRLPRKGYVTALMAVLISGAGILFFAGTIVLWMGRIVDGPTPISCANNLHQLGLAMSCYQSDYSDKFPDPGNWPQQLIGYVKTQGIFRCTVGTDRGFRRYPVKIGRTTESLAVTYAMNERLRGLSVRDVKKPEETVLLFDSNGDKLSGGPELLPRETRHEEREYLVIRHPYINVLFADLHVRKIPVADVPQLKWDPK